MKLTQPPCFFMKKETAVVNHDNFISIRIFRNSHTTCNLGRYHGGGGCAFEAFFRDHVHITLFTNFHANKQITHVIYELCIFSSNAAPTTS